MARLVSILFVAVGAAAMATACAREARSWTADVDAKLKRAEELGAKSATAPTPEKERDLVMEAIGLLDEVIALLPRDSDAYWGARWRLAYLLPVVDCERAKDEVIAQAREHPNKEAMAQKVMAIEMRIRSRGHPEIANELLRESGPLAGIPTELIGLRTGTRR